MFDNYEHWSKFIEGDLFQSWLAKAEDAAGIGILGNIPDMPRGSFRTIVSSKPINSSDDIKGLKLRQYQNELVIDAWTYLGAEVRVLPKPVRIVSGLFSALVGMLFMIAILRAAPTLISIQTSKMDMVDLPLWARSAPLFLSAIMVFLHMLVTFIHIAAGHFVPFVETPIVEEPESQS